MTSSCGTVVLLTGHLLGASDEMQSEWFPYCVAEVVEGDTLCGVKGEQGTSESNFWDEGG